MASGMRLNLKIMAGDYAVSRLNPSDPIPSWATQGRFISITRSGNELSLLCEKSLVPEGVKSVDGWAGLELAGPFDFELTGVLASVLNPLADAKIGILGISSFDTDYVFVKKTNLKRAIQALVDAGHDVQE